PLQHFPAHNCAGADSYSEFLRRSSCLARSAVTARKFSTAWGAERRLFGMQVCWLPGLRGVAFDPSEKIWSAWQTTRDYVAQKSLALHDRDIRLPGNGNEIIGGVAAQ